MFQRLTFGVSIMRIYLAVKHVQDVHTTILHEVSLVAISLATI